MLDLEQLKQRVRRGESFKYLHFWGQQPGPGGRTGPSCLSQWFEAGFSVDQVRYRTAEHWMMAEKARLFGDTEMLTRILEAATPGAAKGLGAKVRGFDEARWIQHRSSIVVAGNVHKFRQNPQLGEYLRSTSRKVLVEASPVDRIWGIGLAKDAEAAHDPLRWRGLNLLGFALMAVREQL
jgi:hypothetical protein